MRSRPVIVLFMAGYASWGATLAGRVVEDHTGLPLASATVRVSRPGQSFLAAEFETDREGRFETAGLAEGEYRLEVGKPNFATTNVPVTLGDGGFSVTARLIRLGVITGRVHDLPNQPVAGTMVFAMPKPPGGGPLRPPGRASYVMATADARGEYRLRGLPPGEYAVVATYGASTRQMGSMGRATTPANLGSGFLFYPTNTRPEFLTVAGGEEYRNIDFTLQGGTLHSVAGKVETGNPESWFWLALVDPQQPALSVAVSSTDKDGVFSFAGVPDGLYRLVAVENSRARGGYGGVPPPSPVFGETRVNLAGANVEGVVLRPDGARSVTFTLAPAPGCPAAARLQLTPLEDWGSVLDRTIPLTAGEAAAVPGLAPMRYMLSATAGNAECYLESEAVLDLGGAASPASVEIRLAPGAAVAGRLDTGGRPPQEFFIALAPAEDSTGVLLAPVDAQARFNFAGLRPGRYRIGAYPAGGKLPNLTRLFEFELRGGSNTQIDLAAPQEGQ